LAAALCILNNASGREMEVGNGKWEMGNGKFAIVARPSFETQLIRTPNALLSPPSRAT